MDQKIQLELICSNIKVRKIISELITFIRYQLEITPSERAILFEQEDNLRHLLRNLETQTWEILHASMENRRL